MHTDLTAEQISFYRENGFLAVDQLLDQGELSEWRAAVEEAIAARPGRRLPHRSQNPKFEAMYQERIDAASSSTDNAVQDDAWEEWHQYYGNVFTQRLYLWKTSDRVKLLVLDTQLAAMAAELEGVDGLRIWQDQALVKESWGHPTAFHIDGPIFPFDNPHCISLWIALDDATLTNGCLAYVPGSHKDQSMRNARIGQDLGGLFRDNTRWAKIQPVFCPLPSGGAVFHNAFTAHGAGANMTPSRRRAMTIVYMEDGTTFDRPDNGTWAWTDEERSRYRQGDRLDHDDQFPLAYRRTPMSAAVIP